MVHRIALFSCALVLAACVGPIERDLPDGANADAVADARACDRGDVPACSNLGVRFEAGDGVPIDVDRAEALYRRACDEGGELACANLAALLPERGGSAEESIALLEGACSDLAPIPCMRLAEALVARGGRGDAEAAAVHFARLCDAFVMPGCVGLGELHETGALGAVDAHAAAAAFARACEREFPRGCMGLARLELQRPPSQRDAEAAVQRYVMACYAGEADACAFAADALAEGDVDLPADPERATELRARACDDGYAPACTP